MHRVFHFFSGLFLSTVFRVLLEEDGDTHYYFYAAPVPEGLPDSRRDKVVGPSLRGDEEPQMSRSSSFVRRMSLSVPTLLPVIYQSVRRGAAQASKHQQLTLTTTV